MKKQATLPLQASHDNLLVRR